MGCREVQTIQGKNRAMTVPSLSLVRCLGHDEIYLFVLHSALAVSDLVVGLIFVLHLLEVLSLIEVVVKTIDMHGLIVGIVHDGVGLQSRLQNQSHLAF